MFEISKEAKTTINAAKKEFGKASLALVRAAAGVGIALQMERINALSIPAARRPKVGEIKEAIRAEFGGLEKEGNRQAYDLCSLAFRVVAKVEKEADAILKEAPGKGATWFEEQVSALAGRATVDAWKAWVMGEKRQPVQKSAGEKLLAYFEKNAAEVGDADLAKLSEMLLGEITKREQVAAEIKAANAA